MKRIPIGLKDYKKLKDENYYVVDKSLMIKEYMDRGSEVTLITRHCGSEEDEAAGAGG